MSRATAGFHYIYERLWEGDYIDEGRDLTQDEFVAVLNEGLALTWDYAASVGRHLRNDPEEVALSRNPFRAQEAE